LPGRRVEPCGPAARSRTRSRHICRRRCREPIEPHASPSRNTEPRSWTSTGCRGTVRSWKSAGRRSIRAAGAESRRRPDRQRNAAGERGLISNTTGWPSTTRH
jgi:hypothetical protein